MSQDENTPELRRQIPLALPMGLVSVVLLSLVALRVFSLTYGTAIEELHEHEIVDLADETQKNADGVRLTLHQLREDVLTLAQNPALQRLLTENASDSTEQDKDDRQRVVTAFQKACIVPALAMENDEKGNDANELSTEKTGAEHGSGKWKPYLKLRLIDAEGDELVRVERKVSGRTTSFTERDTSFTEEELGTERVEVSEGPYFDAPYFKEVRDHYNSAATPVRVFMSAIDFNSERSSDPSTHNVATIRASVPLLDLTGDDHPFRGVVIIDLDLESAISHLTSAPRHIVYIGQQDAQQRFSAGEGQTAIQQGASADSGESDSPGAQSAETGPSVTVIYNPEHACIPDPPPQAAARDASETTASADQSESSPDGSEQNLYVFGDDFRALLERDMQMVRMGGQTYDDEYQRVLDDIFRSEPEQLRPGSSGVLVRTLGDLGKRIPDDTSMRLRLAKGFWLTKLRVIMPEGDDKATAEFCKDLTEKLRKIREDAVNACSEFVQRSPSKDDAASEEEIRKLQELMSTRVPLIVQPNTKIIPIRAASSEKVRKIAEELTRWAADRKAGGLELQYDAPARCEHFACHYFRIYFDPVDSSRYVALLVGFSTEELTADLAETRRSAIESTALWAVAGASLVLLGLWWFVTRPVRQLTIASKRISKGQYASTLPTENRTEIGELSRAFRRMAKDIQAAKDRDLRRNEELNDKVRERTAELEDAKVRLEAALSSRDAFVASVSHELRTPLNHILGFAELLEDTDLDEEQASDLGKLQNSSHHMLRLVKDILDYQKIIVGRLTISPARFPILPLLESARESNEPKALERSNQLILKAEGIEGTVFSDEIRLRQILDNLIGNACKFTKNGTITIEARFKDRFLELTVSDTGIGVSPGQIEKLFQPFSKVANREINPDGTGLGLVICRGLAQKLGGDVTVESTPGEGSSFTVRVLRSVSEEEDDDQSSQLVITSDTVSQVTDLALGKDRKTVSGPQNEGTPAKSAGQVLVIDDDPTVRELISRFIEEDGLEVMTAASGTEGIELAAKHLPSVITLDLVMPDMDGWGVLAALKANERTADIPVVLVSVLEEPQKAYAFGAADYISKPIDAEKLNRLVARYAHGGSRQVLLIDDNPRDREIVRRGLQNAGCAVAEATNGAEGLEQLDSVVPDLVLLDLMMPVMDGFAFIEELRKRDEESRPPVVVLTAKDMTPRDLEQFNGVVSQVMQKAQNGRHQIVEEIYRQLERRRDAE